MQSLKFNNQINSLNHGMKIQMINEGKKSHPKENQGITYIRSYHLDFSILEKWYLFFQGILENTAHSVHKAGLVLY